ncbi:PH domain-containing protein [Lysobacter korlensis]|uniref:PH domain-containing protein n=1 Tax=Lysobacter korlensis TaxID=553636 RepID=A0ABV6RK21_9GAMM
MFGKIASDALGLSDIGVIISPAEYAKVDADDYLFHEDGERIFFLIKSKKDEYCFTNLALIHVDGESAVSSKRSIKRYDYASQRVGEVLIETAGTMDRDVELKFRLGDAVFSIDVKKQFLEQVKDIYKALIAIGRQQMRDMGSRENAVRTLDALGGMLKLGNLANEGAVVAHYDAILDALNTATQVRHHTKDFSDVFERYIHNGAPPPRVTTAG